MVHVHEVPANVLFVLTNLKSGQPRELFKKSGDYEATSTAQLVYPVPARTTVRTFERDTPVVEPTKALVRKYEEAYGLRPQKW